MHTTSPPLQFHAVEGHRIAYLAHHPERGGTPLVFLHGLSVSVRFWEHAMYAEVRDHYAWYSISLPLHAPSTFPRDFREQDIDEHLFFRLLDSTIRHLVGDTPVLLVGHSLGGFAALNFAAKNPAQTLGVVTIGGFATGRARGLEGLLEQMTEQSFISQRFFHLGWRFLQSSRAALRFVVRFYAADKKALAAYPELEPTLAAIYPDVKRHSRRAMRHLFRWLLSLDVTDEAHTITAPVLVMAGDEDPIVPYAHQVRFADALPEGILMTFEGAGHLPFAERPAQFKEGLLYFIRAFATAST